MQNKLPIKARARAIKADKSIKARARAKAVDKSAGKSVDWLGLWAISVGVAAVAVAWVADRTVGGNIGAAFILAGAAALIGLVVGTARAHD